MKGRIAQMEPFSTKLENLKRVVQELWDEMKPSDFIKEIELMPEKLEAVIAAKGLQTKY